MDNNASFDALKALAQSVERHRANTLDAFGAMFDENLTDEERTARMTELTAEQARLKQEAMQNMKDYWRATGQAHLIDEDET
jgi:predicted alpha/beta superfamily hydrolase